MKMKEVCARSGLTEKAVRLYCERGLVHPEKYWERGREYLVFSDHNLRELSVICELRHADFSLDEIAIMLEHPEKSGEVLAGWRGRVAEQNQRLTRAKQKLEDISVHETLSAERVAELLGAKVAAHGAAPYTGETFAEFCERAPSPTDFSEEMQLISQREEQRMARGRLFMILYSVLMGMIAFFQIGLAYAESQSLLPGLIGFAFFVLLTVFLFRGAVWARVVSIARHAISAVFAFLMLPNYFPGSLLFVEHVTYSDGIVEPVYYTMPTGLGIVFTGLFVIAIALDLLCVYMLWFHKGVKDYLYERSL